MVIIPSLGEPGDEISRLKKVARFNLKKRNVMRSKKRILPFCYKISQQNVQVDDSEKGANSVVYLPSPEGIFIFFFFYFYL